MRRCRGADALDDRQHVVIPAGHRDGAGTEGESRLGGVEADAGRAVAGDEDVGPRALRQMGGDRPIPSVTLSGTLAAATGSTPAGVGSSIALACGTRTRSEIIPPYSMPDSGCMPKSDSTGYSIAVGGVAAPAGWARAAAHLERRQCEVAGREPVDLGAESHDLDHCLVAQGEPSALVGPTRTSRGSISQRATAIALMSASPARRASVPGPRPTPSSPERCR